KANNRYMDDLFVYDVNGNRWVCAYPGTDVQNVDLKLDANGFEVDKDGRPTPVAQLGHGYEQQTYDTDLKRFMFMPASSADWRGGLRLRKSAKPGASAEQVCPTTTARGSTMRKREIGICARQPGRQGAAWATSWFMFHQ